MKKRGPRRSLLRAPAGKLSAVTATAAGASAQYLPGVSPHGASDHTVLVQTAKFGDDHVASQDSLVHDSERGLSSP